MILRKLTIDPVRPRPLMEERERLVTKGKRRSESSFYPPCLEGRERLRRDQLLALQKANKAFLTSNPKLL